MVYRMGGPRRKMETFEATYKGKPRLNTGYCNIDNNDAYDLRNCL